MRLSSAVDALPVRHAATASQKVGSTSDTGGESENDCGTLKKSRCTFSNAVPTAAQTSSSVSTILAPVDDSKRSHTDIILRNAAMIVCESRQPNSEGNLGYSQGVHFPVINKNSKSLHNANESHTCTTDKSECVSNSQRLQLINSICHSNIPVVVEIWLYPDCCKSSSNGDVSMSSQLAMDSATPSTQCCDPVLIEVWTFHKILKRLPFDNACSNNSCFSSPSLDENSLYQAIKSHLSFSQLASWLVKSRGDQPRSVQYRVCPGGDVLSPTSKASSKCFDYHNFPSCYVDTESNFLISSQVHFLKRDTYPNGPPNMQCKIHPFNTAGSSSPSKSRQNVKKLDSGAATRDCSSQQEFYSSDLSSSPESVICGVLPESKKHDVCCSSSSSESPVCDLSSGQKAVDELDGDGDNEYDSGTLQSRKKTKQNTKHHHRSPIMGEEMSEFVQEDNGNELELNLAVGEEDVAMLGSNSVNGSSSSSSSLSDSQDFLAQTLRFNKKVEKTTKSDQCKKKNSSGARGDPTILVSKTVVPISTENSSDNFIPSLNDSGDESSCNLENFYLQFGIGMQKSSNHGWDSSSFLSHSSINQDHTNPPEYDSNDEDSLYLSNRLHSVFLENRNKRIASAEASWFEQSSSASTTDVFSKSRRKLFSTGAVDSNQYFRSLLNEPDSVFSLVNSIDDQSYSSYQQLSCNSLDGVNDDTSSDGHNYFRQTSLANRASTFKPRFDSNNRNANDVTTATTNSSSSFSLDLPKNGALLSSHSSFTNQQEAKRDKYLDLALGANNHNISKSRNSNSYYDPYSPSSFTTHQQQFQQSDVQQGLQYEKNTSTDCSPMYGFAGFLLSSDDSNVAAQTTTYHTSSSPSSVCRKKENKRWKKERRQQQKKDDDEYLLYRSSQQLDASDTMPTAQSAPKPQLEHLKLFQSSSTCRTSAASDGKMSQTSSGSKYVFQEQPDRRKLVTGTDTPSIDPSLIKRAFSYCSPNVAFNSRTGLPLSSSPVAFRRMSKSTSFHNKEGLLDFMEDTNNTHEQNRVTSGSSAAMGSEHCYGATGASGACSMTTETMTLADSNLKDKACCYSSSLLSMQDESASLAASIRRCRSLSTRSGSSMSASCGGSGGVDIVGSTTFSSASSSSCSSQLSLVVNFEESVLNGRMEPFGIIEGFKADIGAAGLKFCPKHATIDFSACYYNLSNDGSPSPYFGYISLKSLGKRGYRVPRRGQIQVTLFNPNGSVIKVFIVVYDLDDMPPSHHTFLRQRTFLVSDEDNSEVDNKGVQQQPQPENINEKSNNSNSSGSNRNSNKSLSEKQKKKPVLKYLLHLRFQSTSGSKIYLHTDIRCIFSRSQGFDSSVEKASSSTAADVKLKTVTEVPTNPQYSPSKQP